jgi:hypothetical protein
MRSNFRTALFAAALAAVFGAGSARAQVTPAKGYDPVDDTPGFKVGGVIFADYTYQDKPEATDAAGNTIHPNSFNVSRAYVNVLATISHMLSARITTDIRADSNSNDPALFGSNVIRLKYAYGQVNFDEWIGKNSWARVGLQTTPWIDYEEGIYRYRFQGPTFTDTEGYLTSSDYAIAGHYELPSNYGDFHLGVYNGEGYGSQADQSATNDQKAFQARFSLRPAPGVDVLRGLRVAVFYDGDNYVKDAKKQRFLANATFEYKYVNAGFDWLSAKDQKLPNAAEVNGEGWSAWATPRTDFGLEGLVRYDELKPNKDVSAKKQRLIAGVAYWFPVMKGVAATLMADYTKVTYDTALNKPKEQRWALHTQFTF